ncbi:MAG: hypothetical protein LBT20_01845 [Clostridiales bacterium]|jgi:hypothetical protein|nr:hypothetical protein [Clostridiales bacterium]
MFEEAICKKLRDYLRESSSECKMLHTIFDILRYTDRVDLVRREVKLFVHGALEKVARHLYMDNYDLAKDAVLNIISFLESKDFQEVLNRKSFPEN